MYHAQATYYVVTQAELTHPHQPLVLLAKEYAGWRADPSWRIVYVWLEAKRYNGYVVRRMILAVIPMKSEPYDVPVDTYYSFER